MSYPGRIIRATPVIPTVGSAKGIWTLAEALQAKAQGIWPAVRTGFTADLIPTMTSNNTPSGVASASSEFSAALAAWKCMDKDAATNWTTASVPTGWVQYQFSSAQRIEQYTIKLDNNNQPLARGPRNWTFKGSNNGTDFTTLDTQTNQAQVANVASVYNSFVNGNTYTHYRLDVSANNGDATFLSIGEIQMMAGVYS